MSKKLGGVLALAAMCALSLFLINCGSSSSRPSGVLYVLTQGSNGLGNNVSSFAMDLDSGGLALVNSNASTCPTAATEGNPAPCGLPLDILLDPAGATAFVLNQGTPCVHQGVVCVSGSSSIPPTIFPYTVNSDGSLSAPGTAVSWTTAPDTAIEMIRDAAGQFLFVIDSGLYPAPTACPVIATAAANQVQLDQFTGCPSIWVFAMKLGSPTTLTLVSQSAAVQSPLFLSKTPTAMSALAGAASQELLFVTNNYDLCTVSCQQPGGATGPFPPNDDTVSVYVVGSTGLLAEQTNSPYTVAAADPISVQSVNTNPAQQNTGGLFVYVGSEDSTGGHLYPFQICTAVNLTNCPTQQDVDNNLLVPLATCTEPSCDVPPSSVGQDPIGMVVDPTNNFLYVMAEGTSQVFAFRINSAAGTLGPLSPANLSTGSQPVALALHPSVNNTGQFLYTSNSTSDNISGFTLGTTSGAMSSPISVLAPSAPSGMTVH